MVFLLRSLLVWILYTFICVLVSCLLLFSPFYARKHPYTLSYTHIHNHNRVRKSFTARLDLRWALRWVPCADVYLFYFLSFSLNSIFALLKFYTTCTDSRSQQLLREGSSAGPFCTRTVSFIAPVSSKHFISTYAHIAHFVEFNICAMAD